MWTKGLGFSRGWGGGEGGIGQLENETKLVRVNFKGLSYSTGGQIVRVIFKGVSYSPSGQCHLIAEGNFVCRM